MKKNLAISLFALALVISLIGCTTARPEVTEETDTARPAQVVSEPQADQTAAHTYFKAQDLVDQIRIGWNLGNTLDAHRHGDLSIRDLSVEELEVLWGYNAFGVTTKENINAIKNAGFNIIRIPVTWYKVIDDNYTIRADWMARVKEIVDYAAANDMFIILNTHHDEYIFKVMDNGMEETKVAFRKIWEQIAYTFRNYNEKLIFEGLNEPRTLGSANEWGGGTEEERKNLNILNQLFVDVVRESGGNNARRILMIPTYAASAAEVAQRDLVIPTDKANTENKLIVSIHMYAPWEFAGDKGDGQRSTWSADNPNDTNPIIHGLGLMYEIFVSQGIPVIIGEFGNLNRDNLGYRVAWTEFYVTEAEKRGIPVVWWDNGRIAITRTQDDPDNFGIIDRNDNTFPFPGIIEAMLKATE